MMVARPHGAVLHFEQRPPQFVNTQALRTYLEFRGVTLKRDHPREEATVQAHPESLDPEIRAVTYTYRGVMEILQEMLCSDRNGVPMTQEEFEQMGIADPIPWEYTSPTEMMLSDNFNQVTITITITSTSPPLHPTNLHLHPQVREQCRVFNEAKITRWFGANNANRCVYNVDTHT